MLITRSLLLNNENKTDKIEKYEMKVFEGENGSFVLQLHFPRFSHFESTDILFVSLFRNAIESLAKES